MGQAEHSNRGTRIDERVQDCAETGVLVIRMRDDRQH